MMDEQNRDPIASFDAENAKTISAYQDDQAWNEISARWIEMAFQRRYMYHFKWMGRPIIQLPADVVAVQEIVYQVKPDLIIETGIAHGGSLVLSASMLALLDLEEAVEGGKVYDPSQSRRKVLGIDIDIREHNRQAIEKHPLSNWIEMVEGSSLDKKVIERVHNFSKDYERIVVFLDSNHTHQHVLGELESYAPLVSKNSYCVVFDTIVEDLPDDMFPNRPWERGDNPKTALREYLRILETEGRRAADGGDLSFSRDRHIEGKLMTSVAPEGYLKRV